MNPTPFYNANIPQVTTTFDDWQTLFLDNFFKMNEAFKANHISLTDASKSGNHTIVQLIEQETDIKLQTNIGDFAAFTRLVDSQTDQVFMQYEGNGGEFQYTNYQLYSVPDVPGFQTSFFTSLPGGLIVYFGTLLKSTSNKPSQVTIKLFPPVCKNIVSVNYQLILTPKAGSGSGTAAITKKNEFITSIDIIYNNSSTGFCPFYYFVVGNI